MVIISYDISDDKKRSKFNKYIRKFGHRMQYSVYAIDNSERILNNVCSEIENTFSKEFDQDDSVYIFHLTESCNIIKYGYAKNEDNDIIIIG